MIANDKFFVIVHHALQSRISFSTVRMSDGEKMILEYCKKHKDQLFQTIDRLFDPGWHERFGTSGIPQHTIMARLLEAFNECTWFCPGAGVQYFFPRREEYADKMHTYEWTRAQRATLLREAKQVIVVNRDKKVADNLDSWKKETGAEIIWIGLSNWKQTEDVIRLCCDYPAPLVLLSGGPASKYLAPAVAKLGSRMVLDVGQGADAWWMPTGIEAVSGTAHVGI